MVTWSDYSWSVGETVPAMGKIFKILQDEVVIQPDDGRMFSIAKSELPSKSAQITLKVEEALSPAPERAQSIAPLQGEGNEEETLTPAPLPHGEGKEEEIERMKAQIVELEAALKLARDTSPPAPSPLNGEGNIAQVLTPSPSPQGEGSAMKVEVKTLFHKPVSGGFLMQDDKELGNFLSQGWEVLNIAYTVSGRYVMLKRESLSVEIPPEPKRVAVEEAKREARPTMGFTRIGDVLKREPMPAASMKREPKGIDNEELMKTHPELATIREVGVGGYLEACMIEIKANAIAKMKARYSEGSASYAPFMPTGTGD